MGGGADGEGEGKNLKQTLLSAEPAEGDPSTPNSPPEPHHPSCNQVGGSTD